VFVEIEIQLMCDTVDVLISVVGWMDRESNVCMREFEVFFEGSEMSWSCEFGFSLMVQHWGVLFVLID
jgi:hypothetical protein